MNPGDTNRIDKTINITHIRPQSEKNSWVDKWMRDITFIKFGEYGLKVNYYYRDFHDNVDIFDSDILDLGEFSFESTFKDITNKGFEKHIPIVSTCAEVLLSSLQNNCKICNIEKTDLAKVDHFIARTTWTKNLLYNFGIDNNKLSVIPYAYDSRMKYIRRDITTPTFLYLGSINHIKGLDITIDQFKKTNGGLLKVVPGEFNNEDILMNFLIKNVESDKNITMYKFPGIENLDSIYNSVDVLVYPGCNVEPIQIGHPLLWGLTFGKALISLNQGGPKDFIEDGKNGFLCDSYEEIGNSIQYLINNQDEIKKFCIYSRKKAEKEFDNLIIAKKYNDLYRNILEK